MTDRATKHCYKCGLDRPIEGGWNKNKGKSDGLGSQCSSCSNQTAKEWYSLNRGKHKSKLYDRRKNNKAKLIEHFGSKCMDCQQSYPSCCYDFHHLDPTGKDKGFGQIATHSWKRISDEVIGKCVMLCSNCHRIRHATSD